MKRFPWLFLLLTALLLTVTACALPGLSSGRATTPLPPHQRQGRLPAGTPQSPPQRPPRPQPRGTQQAKPSQGQATAAPASQGEVMVGAIDAHILLNRDPGFGSCGIDPWKSSLCTNGANWWGLRLEAASINLVLIIPDGENRWVLTNNPDVLTAYGYNPDDFKPNGYYQDAAITDYAGDDECHAKIWGNQFAALPMATYENGQFVITFSFDTQPQEYMTGACGRADFTWELSNLLYGWGAAISGDPLDYTTTLTEADADGLGVYRHTFKVDTNPSPENRDHVEVMVEVACFKPVPDQGPGAYNQTPCPWQR